MPNLLRILRDAVVEPQKASTGANTPASTREAPAAPPSQENPFATGNQQVRTAATWFIGALAAVATVLLAGVQLTSVGQLTWEDNPGRLSAAGVAALAAIGSVIYAIYRMSTVFAPLSTQMSDVAAEVANPKNSLAKLVNEDSGFLGGYPSFEELRAELVERRTKLKTANTDVGKFEAALDTASDVAGRRAAEVALQRAQAKVARREERVAELRRPINRLAQILGHQQVTQRFVDARTAVLVCAGITAAAVVIFAYAANPPKPEAAVTPAAPSRPVPVNLILTAQGASELSALLGAACTRQALSGTPGVLLSRTASADDVIILGTGSCPVLRVTLESRLGHSYVIGTVDTSTPTSK